MHIYVKKMVECNLNIYYSLEQLNTFLKFINVSKLHPHPPTHTLLGRSVCALYMQKHLKNIIYIYISYMFVTSNYIRFFWSIFSRPSWAPRFLLMRFCIFIKNFNIIYVASQLLFEISCLII